MSIFRRSVRAHRQKFSRPLRPSVENLEIRMAPAVSQIALVAEAGSTSVVERPTFQRDFDSSAILGSTQSSGTSVRAQSFSESAPSGYSPAEVRAALAIDEIQFPAVAADGAGQTIAIVDAYDDPSFVDSSAPGFNNSDLARFDQAFGLPNPPSFVKVNEYGAQSNLPGTDPAGAGSSKGNWEVEEALDVEWAHAIAPGASIILIECNSASGADMYQGVITAAALPGISRSAW